ncbi:hypothetical protein BGAL_0311g00180 [Botrytis galanthina]|uniref:Uncharacterized protein n=1 Tax=Botrytis galanthina TaxID=278940 RepID=A0A4S8QT17_9HELO|nr:hypothetical protein BGAL_0311g00180 [Botrytis galanthina]
MTPTALQNMRNQHSKCTQVRNELAILLAWVQQDIETIELYKIKAEMTRTCCQQLQYVALLNVLKEGLGKMEERVEHFKEMDLKCVALLEEVEEVLLHLKMPSRIEENKYEIMDILIRMDHAENEIKENTLQIEQIMASGVVTQEEDYTVKSCRRLIKFANGQLACYKYYLSCCLCAEGISDEERIEAERKAYLLHQAAWVCLQEPL